MLMTGRLVKLFIVTVVLLGGAVPALSQQISSARFEALIKPAGWKIPRLRSLVVVSRSPWQEIEDGIEVYRSVLRMRGKNSSILFEDLDFYEFDESGKSLTVRTNSLMVDEIIRYDVAGKAFAYVFSGTCVSLGPRTRRGRSVLYMGCMTRMAFYDEDGDGIFETRNNRLMPGRESVPAWVKQSAKRTSAAATRN